MTGFEVYKMYLALRMHFTKEHYDYQKYRGKVNEKKKLVKSLKTISLREGDIFGIHKVIFKNDNKYLEFQHEALSREVFATGALSAARKVIELSPNLYSIDEF